MSKLIDSRHTIYACFIYIFWTSFHSYFTSSVSWFSSWLFACALATFDSLSQSTIWSCTHYFYKFGMEMLWLQRYMQCVLVLSILWVYSFILHISIICFVFLFMFNGNKNELYEWNVFIFDSLFTKISHNTQKLIRLYRWCMHGFFNKNKLFFFFESANENCYYIKPRNNMRILI